MQWFAYTPEIFSALLIHELVVNSLSGKGLNRILQVFTQVAPGVSVGNVHPLGTQKLCCLCGILGGHGYAELGSEGACCTRKKDSVINGRNALSNFLYNVKFGVVARNIYGRFSCGLQEEANNGAGYLLNFGMFGPWSAGIAVTVTSAESFATMKVSQGARPVTLVRSSA